MEVEYESTEEVPLTNKQRRLYSQKTQEALKQKGLILSPLEVKPRERIAKTFWAKLWYQNLSTYEDLDYRLQEGRSLVSANALLDLNITSLQIKAKVLDQNIYETNICFTALDEKTKDHLSQVLRDEVSSLYDLLSGKISPKICELISDPDRGLFPSLSEISFHCNCLDYANFCSHAAACLFGVCYIFDKDSSLFFTLRNFDPLSQVKAFDNNLDTQVESSLKQDEISSIFGIDLDDTLS